MTKSQGMEASSCGEARLVEACSVVGCVSSAESPCGARVGDGSIEHAAAGLTGLRRYTWWTVPGTTACVLALLLGEWLLDGDVPVCSSATLPGLLRESSGAKLSRRPVGLSPACTVGT